ncbi:MAG: nickel pincer cofactor biosynthesis protein LarC [Propionicimonas sp.]
MWKSGIASSVPLFAWIDARNGVAGDMLLGALVDAGAPLERIRDAVEAVMPATVELHATEVLRAGMRACKVDVTVLADDLPHRNWTTIRAMLESAPLEPLVRTKAQAVFESLAAAEARAHGIDIERVHFHEVGAWDSIADIVGVCAGLAALGVERLLAGTVAVGSGTIATAHGQIPVPVPAVLELSRGWDVVSGGEGELATPTGMALLAALAAPAPGLPRCTIRSIGIGAGTRDDAGRPNVVRVVVGEAGPADSGQERAAVVLEANVDDLDPRVWPEVLDALLVAGADDAWLAPILMKKGRPAHTLQVLVGVERASAVRRVIFDQVPTLGVREHPVTKHTLDRLWYPVTVGGTQVRIKVGHTDGRLVTATPEFVDVAAAAEASGRPVRGVLAEAITAAGIAGLVVGEPLPEGSSGHETGAPR